MKHDEPYHVYRLFNDEGVLIYVGCTRDLNHRLGEHKTRGWWPLVVKVTFETYPDRTQGLRAERETVVTDRPLYNEQRFKATWLALNPGKTIFDVPEYFIGKWTDTRGTVRDALIAKGYPLPNWLNPDYVMTEEELAREAASLA